MPHPAQFTPQQQSQQPQRTQGRIPLRRPLSSIDRFLNPEELLPGPPIPPMDDYEFESIPPTASQSQVSQPAQDRYNQFISEQYIPGVAPPKPSTLGRILSAVQGGVSGWYDNTPSAIDPRETQRRQQAFLYGNYPERVEQLGNAASMLERSANQERQRRHDDILNDYYTGQNQERAYNRARLEESDKENRKLKAEDDRRMREKEYANVLQGSATSPGAILQSNVPRSSLDIAPELPGAPELSKSLAYKVEAESPGYTRFTMRDGEGKVQQLAQPPITSKDRPKSVFEQKLDLLQGNAGALRVEMEKAIADDTPERQQQVRSAFETAITTAGNPATSLTILRCTGPISGPSFPIFQNPDLPA